jgi:hypothetical protein
MAELVVVVVVLGVVVLALWPALHARRRRPQDQPTVTDPGPAPPRRPAEPVPGSQPDRARKRGD